jgi:hypothetical protein
VERARALPPEFGADLLLKVAEGKVDAAWRRELVEEAFVLAARAPDEYPTRGGLHTDTRAHMTSSLFGLDSLTLRLQTVRLTLPMDPERGAGMFTAITLPALPPLGCDANQVPDLEGYYKVLELVYQKGFSAKQRERHEPRHLLNAAIAGMHSPAQVEPLGKVLLSVEGERQELVDAFAGALSQVAPSDRVFARHSRSLLGIVYEAKRKNVDVGPLLRGLHGYLAVHLSGSRCTPNLKRYMELGDEFNALAPEGMRLTKEQMRPERDAGKWDDGEFWQSERSKRVLAEARWLLHGNRDLPDDKRFWTLEERKSQEWTGRYGDFLKLIEGWQESEEGGPIDFRWMQSHALGLAAQLAIPGPARDMALRRWLTQVEQWYTPGVPQHAWFGSMKRLLEVKEFAAGEMRHSRNPVIAAYAEWAAVTQWN